jgi:hypothetical protein
MEKLAAFSFIKFSAKVSDQVCNNKYSLILCLFLACSDSLGSQQFHARLIEHTSIYFILQGSFLSKDEILWLPLQGLDNNPPFL